MTKAEFFQRLRETPRDWQLDAGRFIRRGDHPTRSGGYCPLTAVHGRAYSCSNYDLAARELGLDPELGSQIALAADYVRDDNDLRADLLDACGLIPPSPYQPNDAAFLASVRALARQPIEPVESE